MSEAGPTERPRIGGSGSIRPSSKVETRNAEPMSEQWRSERPAPISFGSLTSPSPNTSLPGPPIEMRAHFNQFAAEMRMHRQREHRTRILEHRRKHLRKAIALASRLRRSASWIQDGMVEIISNDDIGAEVAHLHHHTQDLIDNCFYQWDYDIKALDPVNSTNKLETGLKQKSFLLELSASSQNDCFNFLHNVRSDPRFLIDRFKAISTAQLGSLFTPPKITHLDQNVVASLHQNRGVMSHKRRLQSYAKQLEEYASSLERKNPLAFLIHNCFGSNSATEDGLRVSTWSAICASLQKESYLAFNVVIHHVLSQFANLQGWKAKPRLELFLMDVLQRGAFLLEPVGEYRLKAVSSSYISDTLDTNEAREFFNEAVIQLFDILASSTGGLPTGMCEFARAVQRRLDSVEEQSIFRGLVFFDWYIDHFLNLAIMVPENEEMLLQFHISEPARNGILRQLFTRAATQARAVLDPISSLAMDSRLRNCLLNLISELDPDRGILVEDEDATATPLSSQEPEPAITVCATDIIQSLESLSPQHTHIIDPILHGLSSAFYSETRSMQRYDGLRRELLVQLEPGYSTNSAHPCSESWITFLINKKGEIDRSVIQSQTAKSVDQAVVHHLGPLNTAQRAALRIVLEDLTDNPDYDGLSTSLAGSSLPLHELFSRRMRSAALNENHLEGFYWQGAIEALQDAASAGTWVRPFVEARLFRPLLRNLSQISYSNIEQLEAQVQSLETAYFAIKAIFVKVSRNLNRLKIRMWYRKDVVGSEAYANAKTISQALRLMALPSHLVSQSSGSTSSGTERPSTSASTHSSVLDQPRLETMQILKAPKEYGGPRKLADEQIEKTLKWLEREQVENFCTGEERIHRFCMEVRRTARRLVADTMAESPSLWASDLWTKERIIFEAGSAGPASLQSSSSRPPSVMSDIQSSNAFGSRSQYTTPTTSSRSLDADLVYSSGRKSSVHGSLGSRRLNPDLLSNELFSSISPARSLTNTSGESSIMSIFSATTSLSKSMTTASMYSSASVFSDMEKLRLGDPMSEKSKFLDMMQRELTTLLLSDLANPVWSFGSETDSWVQSAQKNAQILERLTARQRTAQLLHMPKTTSRNNQQQQSKRPKAQPRALSADDSRVTGRKMVLPQALTDQTGQDEREEIREMQLQDLLDKIGYCVDPQAKLQAVNDFRRLALLFQDVESEKKRTADSEEPIAKPRRSSLGVGTTTCSNGQQQSNDHAPKSEDENTEYLKNTLLRLQIKTLFRDLQYIAAFTPSDTLNNTDSGGAFLQVALAAMTSKDEICRAMVDLANSIVTRDGIKRKMSISEQEQPLLKVKEYWMRAAGEGNAIAQRELAGLYLAHPKIPSVVTLPMALSSEIFKDSMMWQDRSETNQNTSALCLALHWMQQAEKNGDPVAKRKLQEREEGGGGRASIPR